MVKSYMITGKTAYRIGLENARQYSFTLESVEDGSAFNVATNDKAEASKIDFGDTVTVTIEKAADTAASADQPAGTAETAPKE